MNGSSHGSSGGGVPEEIPASARRPERPARPVIVDSQGRPRTLSTGVAAFEILSGTGEAASSAVLVLGLGGEPERFPQLLDHIAHQAGVPDAGARFREIAWVECPAFEKALEDVVSQGEIDGARWATAWGRRLDSIDAIGAWIAEKRPLVVRFRQNASLFPEYWSPIYARLVAASLRLEPRGGRRNTHSGRPAVLLPGNDGSLMHRELCRAFGDRGFQVLVLPVDPGERDDRGVTGFGRMGRLLQEHDVRLMLSVNLHGLDKGGEVFHLLRVLDIPVAIWMADNPWHILSTLRQGWWRDALLLSTDASFLPELKAHGARQVAHLPLAASSFFDHPQPGSLPAGTRLLFVGSTAFAGKDKFFAAVPKGGAVQEQAEALLEAERLLPESAAPMAELPDFFWWQQQAGVPRCWPGTEVRFAGWGAEYVSLRRKTIWLSAMASQGLTVVGDSLWKDLLPAQATVLPPVDYYAVLPGLYRAAPFTFNSTSLLLPWGLTQRHFDVWRAGGFLLTTPTRGLDIFPPELTRPITVSCPAMLQETLRRLEADPATRNALGQAWQECLQAAHCYEHRVDALLDLLKQLRAAGWPK